MFLSTRRLLLSLPLMLTALAAHANAATLSPQAVIEDSAASLLRAFDQGTVEPHDPARLRTVVEELLDAHVDFPSVAKLVLGKHWRQAENRQRQRFIAEFRSLLVRTYARALAQSERPSLRVLGEDQRRNGRLARVRAEMATSDGGPPLELAYRLRLTDSGWKIIDVNINGFSLVTNYRNYFKRELRSRMLPQLIDRLSELNRRESGGVERAG